MDETIKKKTTIQVSPDTLYKLKELAAKESLKQGKSLTHDNIVSQLVTTVLSGKCL